MAESRYPNTITLPSGEEWVAVLCRIQSRDENNIPEDLTLCAPGRPIEAVKGDQFVISYMPRALVYPERVFSTEEVESEDT